VQCDLTGWHQVGISSNTIRSVQTRGAPPIVLQLPLEQEVPQPDSSRLSFLLYTYSTEANLSN